MFRKEVVEVTGITKIDEGNAQVEFTWKAVPTPLGEAFDPTSATFKGLPADLQQVITQPRGFSGKKLAQSYGKARRSTALLKLYDDGWRVVAVE